MSIVERLRNYRRRNVAGGRKNRGLHPRLTDGQTAALSFLSVQTGADASAIMRLALDELVTKALGELGVPPSTFGLEPPHEDAA